MSSNLSSRRFSARQLLQYATTALVVAACTGDGVSAPGTARISAETAFAGPPVRFAEIHYDDAGTDAGERIEVSGPVGTDFSQYSVVLYNGSGGATYDTDALSGLTPAVCPGGTRSVVFLSYAVNGIQNGSPDGMALIGPGGAVIEFLSYEGTFTATNGPAVGMTSTNIGVTEVGTEADGQSLKRNGANVWSGPTAHSFGACNDEDEAEPPGPITAVAVTPAEATIQVGQTQQFTAVATDAEGDVVPTTFNWTSNSPAATVNASGLATGQAVGDADITATAPNGVNGSGLLHVVAAPPPGVPATRFSEIHYDNSGVDANEAIEVEGPAGTDLTGWSIALYNQTGGAQYATYALSGVISNSCSGRGVVFVATPGIQNGPADGLALVDATGAVVEFLSYEGTLTASNGPAVGMTSTDIGVSEPGTGPTNSSLQRSNDGATWNPPATSSFGACNTFGGPPPAEYSFQFSGRTSSDVALPVSYQDQLFVTVRNNGVVMNPQPAITWSSDNANATIDERGVMTANAAGTMVLRATIPTGEFGTTSLASIVATASGTALYAGNAEFGEPADADASDDYIVRYPQWISSFNKNKGIPNWVSYNLDPTHFGPQDRCDCFTYDHVLPADFPRYNTADYTGAGDFHGYGIDRGHLARSFDRTSGSLDNARTFLFSNIIPQAADLNQGPWAQMENYLGDLARFSGKEVYIITGPAGSKGTVKNEGKMVLPAQVWKVAVIMPHDKGLADIDSYDDLEVIAVIAPNDAGVRNADWTTWKTTVDAVEALSGYDLLALLRDDIETPLEAGDRPPVASAGGPYTASEGTAFNLDATGSSDPDGQALTYSWTFGDGTTGTGAQPTKTYADNGSYTATVTVTDPYGLSNSASTTVTVNNVNPTATFVVSKTGSRVVLVMSKPTDPSPVDKMTLKYRFDCGNGAGYGALTSTASKSCARPVGAPITVRGMIVDKDGGSTEYAKVVTP